MPVSIQFDLRCAACGNTTTREWAKEKLPTATFCRCGRVMSVLAAQVHQPRAQEFSAHEA
jgi:hypothetical protein